LSEDIQVGYVKCGQSLLFLEGIKLTRFYIMAFLVDVHFFHKFSVSMFELHNGFNSGQ